MLAFLRIVLAASLVSLNTLVHVPILFAATLLKLLVPWVPLRDRLSSWLARIAESWIAVNSTMIGWFTPTRIEVHNAASLDPHGRYLVLCNHRSWCDIPVLQSALNRRAPLLRFFLKQELIWVPLLGPAWWALDFPFMRRHSRAKLMRNPALRTQDLDATRAACAKFANIPVSIMNFVEGTRFTDEKHAKQSPPYRHLLRPRAGGVAAVLDAMAGNLQSVLDVTLIYRDPEPSLAALLAGRLRRIELHVVARAIPEDLASGGDYEADSHYRARCQRWINALWAEKDALIATRMATPAESSS
ncbi:acyltransferase [Xanthomonadaceae bacterium JHOS43]|nr:acyltransferase [Xanthomonadaceae bacterium JHOS43]